MKYKSPVQFRKMKFFSCIDEQIENAMNNNCMVCLQLDANGKVGGDIVNCDPHDHPNGQLLLDLIERKTLVLVNGTDKCAGVITRMRVKNGKVEQSVIDYFLVCQSFYNLIISMIVDEERKFVLTTFSKYIGGTKLVKSDHNIVYLKVKCSWSNTLKKERIEIYNLRNQNCQKQFFEDTSKSNLLTNSLVNKQVTEGGKTWLKRLNTIIHRNFKKIRITSKQKDDKIQKLISLRREDNSTINEEEISNLISERNRKIILDQVSCSADLTGNLSRLKMWKVKQKVCPKIDINLPVAKYDESGNFISNSDEMKNLYVRVYKHRLRHRDIKHGFEQLTLFPTAYFIYRCHGGGFHPPYEKPLNGCFCPIFF